MGNVPASGATVDKDNCTYVVYAVYSNYSREDITAQAEVTGSLVVESSQIEQSHLAGVLTLTATYLGKEASSSVKVYQEAFVPSITAITIDNLTWNIDIPSSGGTASKDNCTYSVTAHWNIKGMTEDVTELASVTGSLVVEASQEAERHAAGTLTLTAEYSGITGSADVTVYQEEYLNYLKFKILSGGNLETCCLVTEEQQHHLRLNIRRTTGNGQALPQPFLIKVQVLQHVKTSSIHLVRNFPLMPAMLSCSGETIRHIHSLITQALTSSYQQPVLM